MISSIVNASNHTKCTFLLLLIYILMNTVKNFNSIHLRLNYIDLLEIVILLMTFLIKYVFQTKLKI